MSTRLQRHAPLPYRMLAGVEPCRGGWLVASARLFGTNMYPVEPEVLPTFVDVLDYKPLFSVIALHCPIGLLEAAPPGGRACEREARRLLGRPRSSAILSAPGRPALEAGDYQKASEINGGLSAVTWTLFPKMVEVDNEMASYRQRTVFEVHPELSFFQLNGDAPLRYSKRMQVGLKERRELLAGRMEGIERIVGVKVKGVHERQLLDAAASLWTARRIAARAVTRLPEDAEWDERGLRTEMVR